MDETSPLMGSSRPQQKGLSSTLRVALRSMSSKLSLQSLNKPKAKRANLNKKSLFVLRPDGPGVRRVSRNASPLNSPRRSPRRSPLRHPRRGASVGSLSIRFYSVQSTTPVRVQFDPGDEHLTADGDDNDDHISISSAPLPALEHDVNDEDPFRTPPRGAVRAALRTRDENIEDDDEDDVDVEMEGSPNSLKRKKSQRKALQILGPEATVDVVKMG